MSAQAFPSISFLAFLFGSTLIASRFSVGQYDPRIYIGFRLVIASVAHGALYGIFRQRYVWPQERRLWIHAIVLGILGTAVPMTAVVTSLQYLSSGLAAILITANPALTVVLAHFFLPDESLTRGKSVGVLMALSGTLLLAFRGESGLAGVTQANPLGYGLMFLAVLGGAASAIYIRLFLHGYHTYDVASIPMFTAAVVVMPLAVVWVGVDLSRVTATGYLALVYAALAGTFGGLLLAVANIKRFGATAAAMTAYLIPIITGIGGVLLLDEYITLVMIGGMVLIIAGVVIINRQQKLVTAVEATPSD